MGSSNPQTIAIRPYASADAFTLTSLFRSSVREIASRDYTSILACGRQSASISPAPPMLYMNAADSVIRQNPAGLTFSYYFPISETGDRMLFDNLTLRDGSFNLVGAATIPTLSGQPAYSAVDGQVAPDGSRVYVLAYAYEATDPSVMPRVFVLSRGLCVSSGYGIRVNRGTFDEATVPFADRR